MRGYFMTTWSKWCIQSLNSSGTLHFCMCTFLMNNLTLSSTALTTCTTSFNINECCFFEVLNYSYLTLTTNQNYSWDKDVYTHSTASCCSSRAYALQWTDIPSNESCQISIKCWISKPNPWEWKKKGYSCLLHRNSCRIQQRSWFRKNIRL